MTEFLENENNESFLNPISKRLKTKRSNKNKPHVSFVQNTRNLSQDIIITVKDIQKTNKNLEKHLHKSQTKMQPIDHHHNKKFNQKIRKLINQDSQQTSHNNSKSVIIESQQQKVISMIRSKKNALLFENLHQSKQKLMQRKLNYSGTTVTLTDKTLPHPKDLLYQLNTIKQKLLSIDVQKISADIQRFRCFQRK